MHIHLTDEQVEEIRRWMTALDDDRTDAEMWRDWEAWAERFLLELVKEADRCQSLTR